MVQKGVSNYELGSRSPANKCVCGQADEDGSRVHPSLRTSVDRRDVRQAPDLRALCDPAAVSGHLPAQHWPWSCVHSSGQPAVRDWVCGICRWDSVEVSDLHPLRLLFDSVRPSSTQLPWYNRTSWLGVKHQLTYLLIHSNCCLTMSDLHPIKQTDHCLCQAFTHSNWPLFNSVRPLSTQTDRCLTVSDFHPLKLTVVLQCQTVTHSDHYLTMSDHHPLKLIII